MSRQVRVREALTTAFASALAFGLAGGFGTVAVAATSPVQAPRGLPQAALEQTTGDSFANSEPFVVRELGMMAREASAVGTKNGGTYDAVGPPTKSTTATEVVTTQFEEHVADGFLEVNLTIDATPNSPGPVVSRSARAYFGVDVCPDEQGRSTGKGTLVLAETSGSGTKASTVIDVTTKGQVGNDAALARVTIDIGGKVDGDQATPGGSNEASWGGGGTLTYGGKVTKPQATFEAPSIGAQSDGPFSIEVVKGIASDQNQLVRKLVENVYRAAEHFWQNGGCVKVDVKPPSKSVEPKQKFKITGKATSKVDGSDIKRALTGKLLKGTTSLDGGDGKFPTTTFAFVGPKSKDSGTVRLTSTSKRGIGKADVIYTTAADYKIDGVVANQHWTAIKCDGLAGRWDVTIKGPEYSSRGPAFFTIDTEPEEGGSVTTVTNLIQFYDPDPAVGFQESYQMTLYADGADTTWGAPAGSPALGIDELFGGAGLSVKTGDFCKN